MLLTNNLSYSYIGETPLVFPDIHLGANQDLLILGRSGVGKTTLLHLIGGLLKPKEGTIQVADTNTTALTAKQMDAYRGKHIGIVFQKPTFVNALSVLDNVKAKLFFSKSTLSIKEIDDLLEELSIADKKNKKVFELSEGQKQRLSIATAICNKPALILADEPTASLDDANAEKVISLLKQQARARQANLVVITHDNRISNYFNNILQL